MAGSQTVRIIAGQWRGRKIRFAANREIRPTPDRVRETLFNWLMPVIEGADCLDLYCGSGILGLEALSRGAASASFVDRDASSIQAVREACTMLGTDRAEFHVRDAVAFIEHNERHYDLVFVDPPYQSDQLLKVTAKIAQGDMLKPGAMIYLEHDQHFDISRLPVNWQAHRQKQAGQVCYSLYRYAG